MKRQIKTHEVNGLNEALAINVLDEPGQGNACHQYQIQPVDLSVANETTPADTARLANAACRISFQNGPIAEVGVNGISNEALLAVVEDRLKGFQSGDYACRENALALTKIQEASMWLLSRTRERVARGVEGTHEK